MQINLRLYSINEACHSLLTGKHEENLPVIPKSAMKAELPSRENNKKRIRKYLS
jgi:hypothetical protein